ncbi:MAG TPA: undecaprenyldiphospho-muramoylpentapeptide beta-N-acetylglucosaminyltransferase [Fibrobacter sp.]|nr:undecaprenyldiphospho-muramoylpentapeptide beta-N-acetylglucosaminyltransferase [Fibrobacter sp.]
MKQKRFLFVCGGTGGHVFPALAIAESLKKMGVTEIHFAGRPNSMEERLVSPHWPFHEITAEPLRRGSFVRNLALPFKLSKSYINAKRVVEKINPDVVVATGGYVSFPIVLAAGRLGKPVYIQEQNAIAGVANKYGAHYASMIFVTSEEALKAFQHPNVKVVGNPVRELPPKSSLSRPPEFAKDKKAVFIVGGSQGAVGINNKIEEAIGRITARDDVNVVWQAGAKNIDALHKRIGILPNVIICSFLDNIYSYMAHADLIISRAGASTLAEILAFGKPSILLPYPHATANHQEHNANAVEKAGACLVELDSDPNQLWDKVEALLGDPSRLEEMSEAATKLGAPDAADKIAAIILKAECES